MEVRTDRCWSYDRPVEVVWSAIADVDAYQRRWPWLTRFDARSLGTGERWRCELHPRFVPYRLRIHIEITHVEPRRRLEAEVTGDIVGRAAVDLAQVGTATEVRLMSELAPQRGLVQAVSRLMPWMARAGHDWVLSTGARQLGRAL